MASAVAGLLNLNDSSSSTNILKTTPPRTPLLNGSFLQRKSPPASMTQVMKSPSTLSFLKAGVGTGTKKNPYFICVDVSLPERNNGFDIQYVESMNFDNSLHAGFHIRRCIPIQDGQFWEATMAPSALVSGNRAILVKGPSQSYWLRDPEKWYDRTKESKCQATRDKHLATHVAIGEGKHGDDANNEEDRFYLYWLLIFPSDITLDNTIFSPGNTRVLAAEMVGMESKLFHGKKEHTHYGAGIFWRIGVKGMSHQLKAAPTYVPPDLSDLFG